VIVDFISGLVKNDFGYLLTRITVCAAAHHKQPVNIFQSALNSETKFFG